MNAKKQYRNRFFVLVGLYVLAVLWNQSQMEQTVDTLPRIMLALLPVLLILIMMREYIKYLRSMDELQRQIQLEALGFSWAATGLITFTLAFLQDVGVPELPIVWVFPMMILLWGAWQPIAQRRYQ